MFLVWLFICYDSTSGFLDWSVQRDLAVSLKNDEPRQEQKVLSLVQKETHPGDFVVSDEPMLAFATERQTPPMLADTSFLRIKSGFLTDEQAINSSRDARMVIFWAQRLKSLPRYRRWVQSNFQLIAQFEGNEGKRKVYLREASHSSPYPDESQR